MPDKPTVFISYRREGGADLARYLNDALKRRGLNVFFDVESLTSGERFETRIKEEIVRREYFLIILTPTTLESQWVQKEVLLAIDCDKTIIPIYTKGFDFYKNIPTHLAKLGDFHAIEYDFRTPNTALQFLTDTIIPKSKRKTNRFVSPIALVLMAAITAAAMIVLLPVMRPSTFATPTATLPQTSTGNTNNFYGDIGTFINGDMLGDVIINEGDSPEEVARKERQRAAHLTTELLTYIAYLDSRLFQIDTILTSIESDPFDEQWANRRATSMPAIVDIAGAGYERLLSDTVISGLRQVLGTYPISGTPNSAFVSLANDAGLDPNNVQFLYAQLGDVLLWTDNLLLAMEDTSEYESEWLRLNYQTLENQTQVAYLAALHLLAELQQQQPDLEISFDMLKILQAPLVLDETIVVEMLNQAAGKMETLSEARDNLAATIQASRDDTLDELPTIDASFIIQPDDSWNIVVAKAVSLRQLGRVEEAVQAFAQYGEKFASDSTAQQYSLTAQAFTRQIAALEIVDGAVYVYEVAPDSAAARAGMQIGDVISRFDGKIISDMWMISDALENIVVGSRVEITVLRLNPQSGDFDLLTVTGVGEKPFGIGIMPI